MVKQKFTEEMRELLASMKGKTLKSYEGVPEFQGRPVEFYGKFRINLGKDSIDFSNLVQETEFPGSVEDVSCFKCKKGEGEFKQYLAGPHLVYMVDERIKSVAIVIDTIRVEDEDYEIEFDMALVIRTNANVYTFTRGWYYWESVEVFVDPKEERPYSIENVQRDWDSIQNNVKISRRMEEL